MKALRSILGVSIALAVPAVAAAKPARIAENSYGLPWQLPDQRGFSAQEREAHRQLEARVRGIGEGFNGDIGIAVQDVASGWSTAFDGNSFFPQQSVSKFWVALAALDRADRGALDLGERVTIGRDDLTLFHQPVARLIGAGGYSAPISDFLFRAITQSDNTCNDTVLRVAGGPDAVRAYLRGRAISGIRFGPGERLLQSAIAGIEWRQSYSVGNGFYAARSAVPASARRAAFESYISDPMDGATPLGIVDALARLKRGELLSAASTARLLSIMGQTKTGALRLKGGLVPGWTLSHKTGTGQVLGGEQAGYNDIGIVTSPDGRSYAVAVMIRRTSAPLGERMAAMQNAVRAVIAYHGLRSDVGMAGRYSAGTTNGTR